MQINDTEKTLDVSLLWTMRVKKEKIDCLLARKVICHNQQPSQYLLAISQQWKQSSNVYNMIKVSNKDTRTKLLTSF